MRKQSVRFQFLYDKLKTQIISGKLPSDSKLPSETELIDTYSVSRYTARKVIEQLAKEKLVYTHQGKGCFVRSAPAFLEYTTNSRQILLIASRAEHFYFLKSINGIERALADSGYTLTIKLSNYSPSVEAALLKEAFHEDYAGILLFPSESAYIYTNLYLYRYIESRRIPCITLGNALPCSSIPGVVTDDYLGGKIAAEYFIKAGHSSLACIMNKEEYSGCMRYAGFEGGINLSSTPVTYSVVWFGHAEKDSIFEDGNNAPLLALAKQATGIFCFNDSAAVNLYRLLTEKGFRVPDDISIIGFDDSYFCETNPVPLTSLHQDPEISGYTAAKNLLHLIKEPGYECSRVFQPYLKERASVKFFR